VRMEARALITALLCGHDPRTSARLGSHGRMGHRESHSFFSGTPSAGIAGEPSRVLPVWDLLSTLSVLPTVLHGISCRDYAISAEPAAALVVACGALQRQQAWA
jgi:hypothetical protein